MVASSVVTTIMILNYHHRLADTHEMPDWVGRHCHCESRRWQIFQPNPDHMRWQIFQPNPDPGGGRYFNLILISLYEYMMLVFESKWKSKKSVKSLKPLIWIGLKGGGSCE